ncbi:MAG: type VI secretion system baseplate subunit TssK [Myxococcota bacterium]|nr:type VI secretion system baseplate subunit TssK [Myxococcota bacterium]
MSHKPIWAEGLFVSQHHFQAQDVYHEGLLRERLGALHRFDWGVLELEIDERLLQAGQFRLRKLAAVWPDGLVVRCGAPSEPATPEPRAFDGLFTPDATHLDVFVGIATESTSANVASPDEPAAYRRFSRVAQSVADFNSGAGVQEVEVAEPNLRIFFGKERQEKVSLLPVAQLARQSGGKIIARDNFVPPVLSVTAAPFLTSGLHRVLGAVTARQRELSAARKQRNSTNIAFHYADARRFWLLHTLNASIPTLTHLLDTQKAHPEEAYLALTTLIAQLGTFAADADPTTLPRFNYLELGEVFEHLFARTLSLLAQGIDESYVELPLQRRQDGMFVGRLPEPRLANHELFIAVKSALPEQVVRERVPQLLKIAAWDHIFEVVKQARHAVRVEVEWNPSGALPVKPGLCFFRVRREGPFWEEIAKSCTIALYLPVDDDWKDVLCYAFAISPEQLR